MRSSSKARKGKAGAGTPEGTGPPPAARLLEEAVLNARVDAAFARCASGDKTACDEFISALFALRAVLLKKFQGKSRRRWYDAEDAFSDAVVEIYEQALARKLERPPSGWFMLLRWQMRKKLWLARRRYAMLVDGQAGREAIRTKEADERTDPGKQAELRDEASKMARQLQEMLTPKQHVVFMARLDGVDYRDAASAANTTPGAARVHEAKAKKKLKKWRDANKVA